MFDIFGEAFVMGFVRLGLPFVVTAVEASDASMELTLNKGSAGEITEPNEALGPEKHHVHGNCQYQGNPAGKLGLAVCKVQSHLLAAI